MSTISINGEKTLWEKAFKRLVLQTRKNQGLFGKGLKRVENIGKGGNAGYQHFLLFPQCFQRASSPRLKKSEITCIW